MICKSTEVERRELGLYLHDRQLEKEEELPNAASSGLNQHVSSPEPKNVSSQEVYGGYLTEARIDVNDAGNTSQLSDHPSEYLHMLSKTGVAQHPAEKLGLCMEYPGQL